MNKVRLNLWDPIYIGLYGAPMGSYGWAMGTQGCVELIYGRKPKVKLDVFPIMWYRKVKQAFLTYIY